MNAFLLGLALTYPHSITPGGVQPGFLRLYPHGDMVAWVNYRGDDGRIHWTDRQVFIPQRQDVLVDRWGNLYRGPCGNSISFLPPKEFTPRAPPDMDEPRISWFPPPEIPGEPWSFAFDLDFAPDGYWPDVPLPPSTPSPRYPPVGHTPVGPAPPLTWADGFPWGSPPPGTVRVSETPEPTTWGMVELGILLLVLHARKRKGE